MYPTADAASRTGVDIDELSTSFWAAVAADRSVLQSRGAALRVRLEAGREVRITHPNGTDLTFEIEGSSVLVSDGVISEEDEQRGGASTMVWLPAGEVYLVPVQDSATGVLVVEREVYEGQVIEGLRLVFESGCLQGTASRPVRTKDHRPSEFSANESVSKWPAPNLQW